MATLKYRLHRKNESGAYDKVHLETTADLVLFPDGTNVKDLIESGMIPIQDEAPTGTEKFWLNTSMKEEFGNIPVQDTEPVGSCVWIDTSEKGAPLPGNNNGFCPQIVVTAFSGSTVTCTKEGITLTAEEMDGTWTFDVPEYGEWNISVNGEILDKIIVNAVKQYNFYSYGQIVNYAMLYDFGDECSDLTGGWSATGYNWRDMEGQSFNLTSGTKNATNMHLEATTGSGYYGRILGTNNLVDTSEYKYFNGFGLTNDSSGGAVTLFLSNTKQGNATNVYDYPYFNTTKSIQTKQITSMKENAYIVGYTVNTKKYLTIYAVWLSKEDDWTPLCSFANINIPGTMAELLSDSMSLTEILANERAVNYMVKKCTGNFMSAAVSSSTFLSVLEKSIHNGIVYANEHWAKFLAMVS